MPHFDATRLRKLITERSISQVDLARDAQVSRATIAKLLNGSADRVHGRTLERLSRALGVSAETLDAKNIQTSYLRAVAEQHEHLDLTGLGIISTGDPISLDDGFVPLNLRVLHDGKDDDNCEHRPHRKPESYSIEDVLARSTRFFLLGDPGSGKTTILRYVARHHIAQSTGTREDKLIPIFVRLAEWAVQLADDNDVDVFQAALGQLGIADPASTESWLKSEAQKTNVLLLLDGLDEAADPDDQVVVFERIRSFVQQHPQAHIIISSRPVGFQHPRFGVPFDTYSVDPLGQDSIVRFAKNWCSFGHGHPPRRKCVRCEDELERIRRAIVDNERIRSLASNPMMLTILCQLHDAGASLPQRRMQLYEKIVEAFLFSWERKKHAALRGTPDRILTVDDRDVRWVLQSIALEMQKRDWTLIPRWWALERTAAFLRDELGYESDKARAHAEALLRSLHERSAMLVERGPETLGFQHLAFQEYFAARAVLEDEDPIKSLRQYFYHPRWREVVRLVSADMDRHKAPQLLRTILDDPDPTGRFLHRGLLLTLGCLADGAPCHHRELLDEVEKLTVQLGSNRWLGIAITAMESLGRMRSSRLNEFAENAAEGMLARSADHLENYQCLSLRCVSILHGFGKDDTASSPNPEDDSWTKPIVVLFRDEKVSITMAQYPRPSDPTWRRQVLDQFQVDPSEDVRALCAHHLGRIAGRDKEIRAALILALASEKSTVVRKAIALGLRFSCSRAPVRRALLELLTNVQENPEVRGASARALRSAALKRRNVREPLLEYAVANDSDAVREGAIRGLARCVSKYPALESSLKDMLIDTSQPERVRVACLWSLESIMPSDDSAVSRLGELLSPGEGSRLSRVAAQVLAEYAATERVPWEKLLVERIEHALISVKDPHPREFEALQALVDAREIRGCGVTREVRIERALSDFRDRIEFLFIFGSAARGEQRADSDIDLMLIGDVSLRELTPALKQAELELGRQVNVVVYSRAEWDRRCAEGNAFVRRVLSTKNQPIIGRLSDLTTVA
ncbi:MAG: NACHT domain-containing protein [Planctomycetes bacterium]|nr:NACHT domain-containing protein [Planctomycetota bacterium]